MAGVDRQHEVKKERNFAEINLDVRELRHRRLTGYMLARILGP